jgi:ankyrin repeat protein
MGRGTDSTNRRAAGTRSPPLSSAEAVRRGAAVGDVAELGRVMPGANLDDRGKGGDAALHIAALNGFPDCVALLLPHSDPMARNANGMTALHCACLGGHAGIAVRLIVGSAPELVDAVDNFERSALHVAAHQGDAATVEALLRAGALATAALDGKTPLHLAARQGHSEALNSLLAAGADPSGRDSDGSTLLHAAASLGSTRCVEMLLGISDLRAVDRMGRSALDVAHESHNPATASLIAARMRVDDEARAISDGLARPAARKTPGRSL